MNADLEQCRLAVHLLFKPEPDRCYELRAINWFEVKKDPGRRFECVVSGYYDDIEKMAEDAMRLSGSAEGVYLIPNPVHRDLICRSKNRLRWRPPHTTADDDIIERQWLLIDCDAIRKTGISSNDAEHLAAVERAADIREFLRGLGQRGLVFASSGNGAHVLIPHIAPNDPITLNKARETLERLAARFNDERVKVDITTHNAARLIKFYGTKVMKGDDCPEEGRPHRISQILEVDEP